LGPGAGVVNLNGTGSDAEGRNSASLRVDRETVRAYLTELYLGVPGLLQIWTDPRRGCGTFFETTEEGIEQAVDQVEAAYTFEGEKSVYARVTTLTDLPPVNPSTGNRGRGAASLSSHFSFLWTDVDFGTVGHADKKLPPDVAAAQAVYDASGLPPASIIVNSGGGLYHIVKLDEPVDVSDPEVRMRITGLSRRWHARVKEAAESLGYSYDTGTTDLARILRVSGSINAKVWANRRAATHVSSGLRYSLAELEKICPLPPMPERSTSFTTEGSSATDARARMDQLLGEMRATTSLRNNTLNKLACWTFQYAGAGQLDPDEVEREFIAAGLYSGLEEGETRRTVQSAREAGLAKPQPWVDYRAERAAARQKQAKKMTAPAEDMWAGELNENGEVTPPAAPTPPVVEEEATAPTDTAPAPEEEPAPKAADTPPPPAAPPATGTKDDKPGPLPIVDITNERDGLLNLSKAIADGNLPEVYVREGQLVHITEVSGTHAEKDQTSTHRAVILDASYMRNMVGRHLVTTKVNAKEKTVPALPTKALCDSVISQQHWPTVNRLRDVIGAPFVRRDGSICQEEGYDEATGMWLALPPGLRQVPENPSDDDVAEARKLILDTVLRDFPWVSPADRANYIALLLTPMLREVCDCVTPLGLITAAAPSSGKSLLSELIACIHGGKMTTLPKQDEELEKRITTFFMNEMVPTITFDNVGLGHTLNSDVLAQLITQRVWSSRILGRSESMSRLNDKLWMVTGNNVRINNDMRTRSILVRIDPRVENPEERDTSAFAVGNLEVWMRQPENKARVAWALLVMVRAWAASGMPKSKDEMRNYTPWAQALGGLLAFHGIEGFRQNKEELADADDEKAEMSLFMEVVHERHGDNWVTAAQLLADYQNASFSTPMGAPDPWQGAFPVDRNGKPVSAKSVGKRLAYYRDRPMGGWVLRHKAVAGRAALWKVERVAPAIPEPRSEEPTGQQTLPVVTTAVSPLQRREEVRGSVATLVRTLSRPPTINRYRHDENRQ
jgi:hypothetical protein